MIFVNKKARKLKSKALREIRRLMMITISPQNFPNYVREALIIEQFSFAPVEYDELERIRDYVCFIFVD